MYFLVLIPQTLLMLYFSLLAIYELGFPFYGMTVDDNELHALWLLNIGTVFFTWLTLRLIYVFANS